VHISLGLLLNSLYDSTIGVAYVADRNTRHKVVVGLTLGGVEEYALGSIDSNHHRRWRGLSDMRKEATTKNLVLTFHKLTISLRRQIYKKSPQKGVIE
jgi:hypothetical protein